MKSLNRMAITVVRLLAAGFAVVGLLNLAIYWGKNQRSHTAMQIGRTLWLSVPLVIGLALLAFSSKIARRINELLDIE